MEILEERGENQSVPIGSSISDKLPSLLSPLDLVDERAMAWETDSYLVQVKPARKE